jgi:TonB family protein
MQLSRHCVRRSGPGFGQQSVFFAVFFLLLMVASSSSLHAQKAKIGRAVVATVTPDYPETLQHAKIGGQVKLTVTVLASGTVSKVQIRGGNPILAESAVTAVMKWKYAPGPVETSEEVSLNFSAH